MKVEYLPRNIKQWHERVTEIRRRVSKKRKG